MFTTNEKNNKKRFLLLEFKEYVIHRNTSEAIKIMLDSDGSLLVDMLMIIQNENGYSNFLIELLKKDIGYGLKIMIIQILKDFHFNLFLEILPNILNNFTEYSVNPEFIIKMIYFYEYLDKETIEKLSTIIFDIYKTTKNKNIQITCIEVLINTHQNYHIHEISKEITASKNAYMNWKINKYLVKAN